MASKNKLFRVTQTMSRVFLIEAEDYEAAHYIKDSLWHYDFIVERIEETTETINDDMTELEPDEGFDEAAYWVIYEDGDLLDCR